MTRFDKIPGGARLPCLTCSDVVAVPLPGIEGINVVCAFCSIECAADWACQNIASGSITFCVRHQNWTDHHGFCDECLSDVEESHISPCAPTRQYDDVGRSDPADAQGEGKDGAS